MKRVLIRLCFLLSLILVSYTLIIVTAIAISNNNCSNWSIVTLDDVDSGYYIHHSYTSIAVDSEDNIHISYRGPDYDLRYATNKNNGWSTEVVHDASPYVARENSIAVDSNNHPHISFSFSDGRNEDLRYAQNIIGTWVISSIDSVGSVGMENDIALDSNDNVHISHYQWNGAYLKYSTNKSGSWESEVITVATWDRTSIAIDSSDKVHIVFRDPGKIITLTTNLNDSWEMTTIDTCVGVHSAPAIAIDSNDKVHISYSCGSDLKYATNVSGSWETTTIGGP